ncbi:MAG: YraN family protein [Bacteroidia bacterium]|nr:YraN family protein [Bacteroidia bacterium]
MIKQILGANGEKFATEFLIKSGYQILHQNWRYKSLEVDIIALYQGILVFVEVKTRKNNYASEAIVTITLAKQERLIRAAEYYLEQQKSISEIRFDVVTVLGTNKNNFRVELIQDAFR